MDGEEDEPLPPSDLGGVPWKEAVRIHALLKGKSEEELEALQGRAPGSDGDEDDDEDGDEDDDEDEDGSSEGQEAPLAPALTRSGPGMPPQGSRDALPTSMSPDSGTQQATDSGDSVPCAHSGQRPRGGVPSRRAPLSLQFPLTEPTDQGDWAFWKIPWPLSGRGCEAPHVRPEPVTERTAASKVPAGRGPSGTMQLV